VSEQRSYASPAAFRRALTDRLQSQAERGRWTLPQLQRQIAYDRLLERLYLVDDAWVVKGATALLAREIGVRASLDVDVYREAARDVAERELRDAVTKDIGDWFRFELGAPRPVADGAAGIRLPVKAYVGETIWAEFHVDLVGSDLRMTGHPDDVPPIARIVMPDVEQHGYKAYPLVDHVADKVAAILERHGEAERPSTRFRDLVDLVAIVSEASVEARPQMVALSSEGARRSLNLPARFAVPDETLWEPGFAAEAQRAVMPRARTLDEALAIVRPFLDPLLDGTASGRWDPNSRTWTGE
jgi:nucleotidyltransferase AbiEii toxin of type IV toxin-antitoxin system